MKLKFTKMHGNQNDFIVFQNESWTTGELSRLAVKLCERRASVGADGLLVIENDVEISDGGADFRLRIFNADGSEAEMCGNGARCIAKYASDNKTSFSTIAGLMRAEISGDEVALDMGKVNASASEGTFSWKGLNLQYAFFTVGVPHCVVFADALDLDDRETIFTLGHLIRNDAAKFPQGANVNFVKKIDGKVWAVTYERGVEALTDSCGTGCVAVALALHIFRSEPVPVKIRNPGGVNEVFLNPERDMFDVVLKGKVATAFVGEVEICAE